MNYICSPVNNPVWLVNFKLFVGKEVDLLYSNPVWLVDFKLFVGKEVGKRNHIFQGHIESGRIVKA